jgi:hypothetical protein
VDGEKLDDKIEARLAKRQAAKLSSDDDLVDVWVQGSKVKRDTLKFDHYYIIVYEHAPGGKFSVEVAPFMGHDKDMSKPGLAKDPVRSSLQSLRAVPPMKVMRLPERKRSCVRRIAYSARHRIP